MFLKGYLIPFWSHRIVFDMSFKSILRPSWAILRKCWAILGPSWGHLGAILGVQARHGPEWKMDKMKENQWKIGRARTVRGLSLLGPPIEVRLLWTWPKSRKCDLVWFFWPHEYFLKMDATLIEYAARGAMCAAYCILQYNMQFSFSGYFWKA